TPRVAADLVAVYARAAAVGGAVRVGTGRARKSRAGADCPIVGGIAVRGDTGARHMACRSISEGCATGPGDCHGGVGAPAYRAFPAAPSEARPSGPGGGPCP